MMIAKHNEKNLIKGILAVAVTGSLTIASAYVCKRSIIARKFVPKLFDSNISHPQFNAVKEASKAVNYATMLSGSLIAFLVSCASLGTGSGSLHNLACFMKANYAKDYSDMQVDPESAVFENKMLDILRKR